jgi:hypothetical protein
MTSLLRRRDVVPDDAAFEASVGTAAGPWALLTRRVSMDMGARATPSWGGANAGWELRFRRAGRPFVTLSPGDDSFRACIVLGTRERSEAEAASLSIGARAILEAARRFPDGTWLFITVRTTGDVGTVLEFLELKLPTRVRRSLLTTA